MSAALYRNIALREHRDRTRSLKREAAAGYTEATGVAESVKYTGTWEEVLAKAADICGEPEDAMEVACTCTRLSAGLGELTVQYTEHRVPVGADSETSEAPLGSKENPQYSFSTTEVAEPLLGHPYFKDQLSEEECWILQQYAGGAHPDSEQTYGGKTGVLKDLCAALTGKAAELYDFYKQGITQYYEVYADATARWKGEPLGYAWHTIQTPPGPVKTPAGRNWLYLGEGAEESGGEIWRTARFKLSGAGGWNPKLYGSQS